MVQPSQRGNSALPITVASARAEPRSTAQRLARSRHVSTYEAIAVKPGWRDQVRPARMLARVCPRGIEVVPIGWEARVGEHLDRFEAGEVLNVETLP